MIKIHYLLLLISEDNQLFYFLNEAYKSALRTPQLIEISRIMTHKRGFFSYHEEVVKVINNKNE
jgi:hypothetical protein